MNLLYLYAKGKQEQSQTILKKWAKRNGNNPEEVDISTILEPKAEKSKFTALDLFKNGKLMAIITLNCCFNWVANALVYWGISLGAGGIPGNIIFTNAMYGFIEIPAILMFGFSMNWKFLGRKKSLALFLILGGCSCLLSMF